MTKFTVSTKMTHMMITQQQKLHEKEKKRLKSFISIDNFPAINKPADVAMALRLQIQHATNL